MGKGTRYWSDIQAEKPERVLFGCCLGVDRCGVIIRINCLSFSLRSAAAIFALLGVKKESIASYTEEYWCPNNALSESSATDLAAVLLASESNRLIIASGLCVKLFLSSWRNCANCAMADEWGSLRFCGSCWRWLFTQITVNPPFKLVEELIVPQNHTFYKIKLLRADNFSKVQLLW